MGDQRIEPGVFRDDMEECFQLLRSYLPDVVGNMKIQCIGPIAGNSDVFGSATKGLHACNEIERELCQRGTNENLYSEVVSLEQCEVLGLYILIVDQDVVGLHEGGLIQSALFVQRSEEHTSELQSLMRISYAVFCLKKKNKTQYDNMK